jgi:hypothetical protein
VTSDRTASGYETLPSEPGLYRVKTASGTDHIIERAGRIYWERRPRPGAMVAAHDNKAVCLSQLGPGWEVGGQRYLEVSDETYLSGKTWHLTATITSITDEPRP